MRRFRSLLILTALFGCAMGWTNCEGVEPRSVELELLKVDVLADDSVSIIRDQSVYSKRVRKKDEVGSKWELTAFGKKLRKELNFTFGSFLDATVYHSNEHSAAFWYSTSRDSIFGNIAIMYVGLVPLHSYQSNPRIPTSTFGAQTLYLCNARESVFTLIDTDSRCRGTGQYFKDPQRRCQLSDARFDCTGRNLVYSVADSAFLYDISNRTRIPVAGQNKITPAQNGPFFVGFNYANHRYTLLNSALDSLGSVAGPLPLEMDGFFLLDSDHVALTIKPEGITYNSLTCLLLNFHNGTLQELLTFSPIGQILSARFIQDSLSASPKH